MDVSIIIVNFNTFKYTSKCISSVVKYTQGVSYEIIVVDNASTECPPDVFKKEFPGIELIVSKNNTGFTGGNNLGIERAKGECILLLNSDAELTEDSISDCLKFLKAHEKTGVISCKLLYPDGTIQKQCQRFPSISLTLLELLRLHKLIPQPKRGVMLQGGFFDHRTAIYCDSVWGAFFMFPKKVLNSFEGNKLPGDFFMYAEDMLWCYAIKKSGYNIYYNANTSLIHHMGASAQPNVLVHKHQNEYNIILKYNGILYAKALMFLRGLLYYTHKGRQGYASLVAGISFKLFFKGKVE